MAHLLLQQNILKQQRIYSKLFEKHNISYRSLHWSGLEYQRVRFEQFLSVGDLNGRTILDIGSGLGCFYGFLLEHEIHCDYLGVDIVPKFIQNAKKLYPSGNFIQQNIITTSINQKFDYVFASGLFAFGSRLFFETMNKIAFGLAKKAWVYNLYFPKNDRRFFSIDRNELEKINFSLNFKKAIYQDGYLQRDLTVFIYK